MFDFTGKPQTQKKNNQSTFDFTGGNKTPQVQTQPIQQPTPPKPKSRLWQAFNTAVQEAPGYKLFSKGLAAVDNVLKIAPPAPREEFKPKGIEWAPYVAGKIIGETPTVALSYLTGGAGAARLLPKAVPELTKLATRGAGAGLTHGLIRQVAEPEPLPEAIKNITLETAGFAAADPAVSWLGKQAKHFIKPVEMRTLKNLDFTKPSSIQPALKAQPKPDIATITNKPLMEAAGAEVKPVLDMQARHNAIPTSSSSQGIKVYRGYSSGTDPTEANLTRVQTLDQVLGKNQKRYEPVNVEYYTENIDAAKKYANQDDVTIQGLMKTTGKNRVDAEESFKTLVGRGPIYKGIVKEHTISPKKVLDLSHLGESPDWRDIVYAMLKTEGSPVPKYIKGENINTPKWERFQKLESEFVSNKLPEEEEILPVWKLLRNYTAEDNSAQKFVEWMNKNGYDAIRYAEDGTNHYAVLKTKIKEKPSMDTAVNSDIKLPEIGTPQNKLFQQTGVNIGETAKGWKDKAKLLLKRETMERNFEAIAGKDAPKMIKTFIDPIHQRESDRIRWLTQERANISSLGIKPRSKESTLVQKYGEGVVTEEQLKGLSPKNWGKVKTASEAIRQKYDNYITSLNTVLERNGYDPIQKRKDYFRHFEDVTSLFEQYGIPRRKLEDLPTDINGLTADFRPGKSFFANALMRKGNKTTYDAVTGIDGYLEGASRVMFHTDNIQRLRVLEKAIRKEYGGTKHLSNFAAELTEYTNILSGKKAMMDRAVEDLTGRNIYVMLDWAKRKVGANMIGANISSALTQYIPLTQSLATTSKPAMLRALKDTVAGVVKNDGLVKKSNFLTRRFGSDPLSMDLWQKASNKASWLFRSIDKFSSELIVRGKYYEGLSKGLKPDKALDQADKWAARIMADRSLGAMPTLFSSRTLGVFTQFQLEVNNQISFLMKDIPASKETKLGLASAVTQLFLYGYMFNGLFEKLAGYRPALDPIGVAKKALEDYGDPQIKTNKATTNLIENISNQLPFSSIVSGGRIPLEAAIFNPLNIARGESTLGKEISKPLTYMLPPFGGGQVRKTIRGINTLNDKGVYNEEGTQLKYPVAEDAGNVLSGLVFGPSGFRETNDYYRKGRQPLTEKQTQELKRSRSPNDVYNKIQNEKTIKSIDSQIEKIRKDRTIPPAQKKQEIDKLMIMRGKMKKGSN